MSDLYSANINVLLLLLERSLSFTSNAVFYFNIITFVGGYT